MHASSIGYRAARVAEFSHSCVGLGFVESRQGYLQEHAVNQVNSDRPDAPSLRMSGVVRTAVTTDRETRVAFGRGKDVRGSSPVRGHLTEGGRSAYPSKSKAGDDAVNWSAFTKASSQYERNTKAA